MLSGLFQILAHVDNCWGWNVAYSLELNDNCSVASSPDIITITIISSYRNLHHVNLFSDRHPLLSWSCDRKFSARCDEPPSSGNTCLRGSSEGSAWQVAGFRANNNKKACCTRPEQQLCAVTTGLVTNTCNKMVSFWQHEMDSKTLLDFLYIDFYLQ